MKNWKWTTKVASAHIGFCLIEISCKVWIFSQKKTKHWNSLIYFTPELNVFQASMSKRLLSSFYIRNDGICDAERENVQKTMNKEKC